MGGGGSTMLPYKEIYYPEIFIFLFCKQNSTLFLFKIYGREETKKIQMMGGRYAPSCVQHGKLNRCSPELLDTKTSVCDQSSSTF